jgi:hypothetical protein
LVSGVLDQAALLAALRPVDLDLAAGLLGEGLGEQLAFGGSTLTRISLGIGLSS